MNRYANVGAVCRDCAKKAGFTPKRKIVGVWMDECGICHEKKPCTSLHHDWITKTAQHYRKGGRRK
jgi:hypothetical protein